MACRWLDCALSPAPVESGSRRAASVPAGGAGQRSGVALHVEAAMFGLEVLQSAFLIREAEREAHAHPAVFERRRVKAEPRARARASHLLTARLRVVVAPHAPARVRHEEGRAGQGGNAAHVVSGSVRSVPVLIHGSDHQVVRLIVVEVHQFIRRDTRRNDHLRFALLMPEIVPILHNRSRRYWVAFLAVAIRNTDGLLRLDHDTPIWKRQFETEGRDACA